MDHIPLLQALMEQWRAELARQPLAMSEVQACETLGITAGADGVVTEDDLRKAYRALARRYVWGILQDSTSCSLCRSAQQHEDASVPTANHLLH